jgi:hypothetical protein
MIDLFLITQLIAANPETQKLCAAAVGIPYASDNFTDAEWKQFQNCMTFFERQEQRQQRPGAPVSAPVVTQGSLIPVAPSSAFQGA